jgi:acyl-CoA thioester hydrolase|tara:strand:+ start:29054 stop:29509 length:456 start_codon:yes stop_codon:yes gene_type:complete
VEDLLKGFPVVVEQPLNWGDMDMHGHINNVWLFRYIENARIAYYEAIGKHQHEQASGTSFVLAATSCTFKSALVYPDVAVVGARIEEILTDRAVMGYRVVSREHHRVAAEARATLVSYDYAKGEKVVFPEVLTQRIHALEGKSYRGKEQQR